MDCTRDVLDPTGLLRTPNDMAIEQLTILEVWYESYLTLGLVFRWRSLLVSCVSQEKRLLIWCCRFSGRSFWALTWRKQRGTQGKKFHLCMVEEESDGRVAGCTAHKATLQQHTRRMLKISFQSTWWRHYRCEYVLVRRSGTTLLVRIIWTTSQSLCLTLNTSCIFSLLGPLFSSPK